MPEQLIPTDQFSRRRRELAGIPGAVSATTTITLPDFYGNLETWVIETFRHDGEDTGFIQRNTAEGGSRWLLPPKVMEVLARQRESAITRTRRQSARQALETKRSKGLPIGNPEALATARARRAKGGGRRPERRRGTAR